MFVFASVEEANTNMQTLIDQLGFKAIDDYTFEVKLATPTPYFLSLMAFPAFYPVNEAFVNEVTEDKFGTSVDTFLYNGPFLFTEWKISKSFYLTKNELLLAALLKVGFSNKQLMIVFDCEMKSIYKNRQRLKADLGLTKNDSLEQMIMMY